MTPDAASAAPPEDPPEMDHERRAKSKGLRAAFDGLGIRLAVMLAVALFPLLIIAILQSSSVAREAQAKSEAALMGETMRAVAGETRVIQHAQDAARLLSSTVLPVIDDKAACSALMGKVLLSNNF